jgi:hypothetical protein
MPFDFLFLLSPFGSWCGEFGAIKNLNNSTLMEGGLKIRMTHSIKLQLIEYNVHGLKRHSEIS